MWNGVGVYSRPLAAPNLAFAWRDDHDETDSKDESYSEKEFGDRQEKKLISDIISNINGKEYFASTMLFHVKLSSTSTPLIL